jgi:hypothetical protein
MIRLQLVCLASSGLMAAGAASAATPFYVYPDRVEVDVSCPLPAEQIRALDARYSRPEHGAAGVAHVSPVDLNGDGECELFLDNPEVDEGNGYGFTTVLIRRDGDFVTAGDMPDGPDGWWFGERHAGFLRIFVPMNAGPKANPEFVTAVFAFDGTRYAQESGRTATHGYYMDQGRSALRAGDFAVAEASYLDALRMNKAPMLSDANNLALVWLKMGKAREAKALLESLLNDGERPAVRAAAYFNAGLIEQQLGDMEAALRNFRRAVDLEPTEARMKKLRELEARAER